MFKIIFVFSGHSVGGAYKGYPGYPGYPGGYPAYHGYPPYSPYSSDPSKDPQRRYYLFLSLFFFYNNSDCKKNK